MRPKNRTEVKEDQISMALGDEKKNNNKVERNNVEDALRVSETHFKQFFENSPDYCYMISPDGIILDVNQSALKILGYKKQNLVGKALEMIYAPESLPKMKENFQKWKTTGKLVNEEMTILTKSQKRRTVLLSADAIKDKDGKILSSISIQRDITDRKRVEEELRESEEKFRQLAEKSPNMIFINKRGRVIYANEKCEEIMGYNLKEFYSPDFNFLNMVEPEFHPAIKVNFKKHLKGDEVPPIEFTIVTKKGQRIEVILTTKLIKYGGETTILGIINDITERKLAEEELCKYRDHLEELVNQRTNQLQETNAELEAFVYSVSHDLQAPLRTMQGFAQLLLKDYGSKFDIDGKEYTKRIIESSKYMNNMIRNLLAYSRMSRDEIRFMTVSLSKIIHEIRNQLESKIMKVHAEITIKPPLPSVKANKTILMEVITNLFLNAITFVQQDSKPKVNIWSEVHDRQIRLYIEDNGIGIAPEYQDKIFRIFERLHGIEKYPGTGIGLAIVKKGIERMGGSVGVESEPGMGSRFWIELENVGEN